MSQYEAYHVCTNKILISTRLDWHPCDHWVRVEWNTWHWRLQQWHWRSLKLKMILSRPASGSLSRYTDPWSNLIDHLLTSIEVIVVCTLQIGKWIGLMGANLEGITLDPPGENTDPSAGCDEQRAVAVVGAEMPLQQDTSITATDSPRPQGSGWAVGLGLFLGEPLMTRPSGCSLPWLQSILWFFWLTWM